MPPKKSETTANPTVEETLATMTTQLATLLASSKNTETKVTNLENMLKKSQEENAELKAHIKEQEHEIRDLKTNLNNLEQHHRANSVRINKLVIAGDDSDIVNVREQVYNQVLLPIFQGLVQNGKRSTVPTAEQLIEMCHVLPGREDRPRPIICRLHSRFHKTEIMLNKREYLPKVGVSESGAAARGGKPPPLKYVVVDDLTRLNYVKMRELAADERVLACWSVGGQLRLRLRDNPGSRSSRPSMTSTPLLTLPECPLSTVH